MSLQSCGELGYPPERGLSMWNGSRELPHSARSLHWLRTRGNLPNISPAQRFAGSSFFRLSDPVNNGLDLSQNMLGRSRDDGWINMGRNDRLCRSTAEPADFSTKPVPREEFSQYSYCGHAHKFPWALAFLHLPRVPSGSEGVYIHPQWVVRSPLQHQSGSGSHKSET